MNINPDHPTPEPRKEQYFKLVVQGGPLGPIELNEEECQLLVNLLAVKEELPLNAKNLMHTLAKPLVRIAELQPINHKVATVLALTLHAHSTTTIEKTAAPTDPIWNTKPKDQ